MTLNRSRDSRDGIVGWDVERELDEGLGQLATFQELKYIRVEEVEPKIR